MYAREDFQQRRASPNSQIKLVSHTQEQQQTERKAVRITSGWKMAQEDWAHELFIYQAEGDMISVSIPTVVSKHGGKAMVVEG